METLIMTGVRKYYYKNNNNEDSILEMEYYLPRYDCSDKSFQWTNEEGKQCSFSSKEEDTLGITSWSLISRIYEVYKQSIGYLEFKDKYYYVEYSMGLPDMEVEVTVKIKDNFIEIPELDINVDTSIPFNLLEVLDSIGCNTKCYYTIDNTISNLVFKSKNSWYCRGLDDAWFNWLDNNKLATFYIKSGRHTNFNNLIELYTKYKEHPKDTIFEDKYEQYDQKRNIIYKESYIVEVNNNIFTIKYDNGLQLTVNMLDKFNLIEQMITIEQY